MKKRYRFVGNPKTYIWDVKPVVGEIYPEDHCGTYNGTPYTPLNEKDFNGNSVLDMVYDWEEVDEELEDVLGSFKAELRDLLEKYGAVIETEDFSPCTERRFVVSFGGGQEVVLAESIWLDSDGLLGN